MQDALGLRSRSGSRLNNRSQWRDRTGFSPASVPETIRPVTILRTGVLSNSHRGCCSDPLATRGRGPSEDALGYVIIGIFVLSWVGSVVFYTLKGYDELEVNTAGGG
jgi:hypothetical protein